jgi:secondary thiamine-phosphate synthase enzyme
MRQETREIVVGTRGKGLTEVTTAVADFVREGAVATGLLTVFCRHTSASLLIQENADPDVQTDLERFFERVAPEGDGYVHASEGPDDMPAHIRAALTQAHLSIPVVEGRMVLGTWQGIYLFEHRRAPHRRRLMLHLIGA